MSTILEKKLPLKKDIHPSQYSIKNVKVRTLPWVRLKMHSCKCSKTELA